MSKDLNVAQKIIFDFIIVSCRKPWLYMNFTWLYMALHELYLMWPRVGGALEPLQMSCVHPRGAHLAPLVCEVGGFGGGVELPGVGVPWA